MSLSPREQELLALYPTHGTHQAIALALGVTLWTVKNMASSIIRKTGCATLGQAAIAYDRLGRGERRSQPERRQGERRAG